MNIFDLRLLASAEYILIKKSSSVSGLWWNIRFNLELHYCALCLFTMGSFIRGIGIYSGQQQMRHPPMVMEGRDLKIIAVQFTNKGNWKSGI